MAPASDVVAKGTRVGYLFCHTLILDAHAPSRLGVLQDYTPFACSKIISGTPGVGDHHGCPFKTFRYAMDLTKRAADIVQGVTIGSKVCQTGPSRPVQVKASAKKSEVGEADKMARTTALTDIPSIVLLLCHCIQ